MAPGPLCDQNELGAFQDEIYVEETVNITALNQLFEEMVFNICHTVLLCLTITALMIHTLVYSLIEQSIAIRHLDK